MMLLESFILDNLEGENSYRDLVYLFEAPLLRASQKKYKSQFSERLLGGSFNAIFKFGNHSDNTNINRGGLLRQKKKVFITEKKQKTKKNKNRMYKTQTKCKKIVPFSSDCFRHFSFSVCYAKTAEKQIFFNWISNKKSEK